MLKIARSPLPHPRWPPPHPRWLPARTTLPVAGPSSEPGAQHRDPGHGHRPKTPQAPAPGRSGMCPVPLKNLPSTGGLSSPPFEPRTPLHTDTTTHLHDGRGGRDHTGTTTPRLTGTRGVTHSSGSLSPPARKDSHRGKSTNAAHRGLSSRGPVVKRSRTRHGPPAGHLLEVVPRGGRRGQRPGAQSGGGRGALV